MLNGTNELHDMHRLAVYCNREVSYKCIGHFAVLYVYQAGTINLNQKKMRKVVAKVCAIQVTSHGMASCGITTEK